MATPGIARTALRAGYLTRLENAAQSVGTLAPTITIAVGLPIILGEAGHASMLLIGAVLVIFLGVAAGVYPLASRSASAGSLGAYTVIGLGRRAGIAASWTYILAMAFVAISAIVCGELCVDLLLERWVGPAHGPWRSLLIPTVIMGAAWLCAHRDVRLSTKVMLATEMVSLGLLCAILLVALSKGFWWDKRQLDFTDAPWNGVRLAFIVAATALSGFESASALGEEVVDGRRSVPRTMLWCLVPTGLVYLAATYALGLLEDRYRVRLWDASMPFDLLARSAGVPYLGSASLAGIAVSTFAAALAGISAASRVMYDLSRQGALPAFLGRIHPTHATPTRAVALFALLGIGVSAGLFLEDVPAADSINYTIQVASYGFMASYFLVCLAACVFLLKSGLGRLRVFAAGAGVVGMLVVIGMSLIPLPDAPWSYVAFVALALPACGYAWSELYLRSGRAVSSATQ